MAIWWRYHKKTNKISPLKVGKSSEISGFPTSCWGNKILTKTKLPEESNYYKYFSTYEEAHKLVLDREENRLWALLMTVGAKKDLIALIKKQEKPELS